MKESIPALLALSALLVAMMPGFYLIDRRYLHEILQSRLHVQLPLLISALIYCLPCIPFGCLFGQVLARSARNWGNDVGRYYGLNTLGSCLGILLMTLVGYEMNHAYAALLIAAGYFVLFLNSRRSLAIAAPAGLGKWLPRLSAAGFTACLLVLAPFYLAYDFRPSLFVPSLMSETWTTYYGKSGVVEVLGNGCMYWDGLWHSRLSVDGNHVGHNNWLLAAVPFLCHDGQHIDDALVIGLGTGITAATLAKSDRVESVDVYEIDRELDKILHDYPQGTLHLAENPKAHVIWQDGRAGLALNEKRYDLITQQPLYLMQAGSSILLSEEYMELVKKRLKPKGVFCIYSNAGSNPEQALLVRKTAAGVFPYCESFGKRYMIVASKSPFSFDTDRLRDTGDSDPLIEEIRSVGIHRMKDYIDSPRLEWEACPYVNSDNHPLVEYPGVVRTLLTAGRPSRQTVQR